MSREKMTHHKLHGVGGCPSIDQDTQSARVELGCTTLHDRGQDRAGLQSVKDT